MTDNLNKAPETQPKAESVPNLTYEELHRKCRDVFPICFEGAKLIVSKGLSSHFQVFLLLYLFVYLDKFFILGFSYINTFTSMHRLSFWFNFYRLKYDWL